MCHYCKIVIEDPDKKRKLAVAYINSMYKERDLHPFGSREWLRCDYALRGAQGAYYDKYPSRPVIEEALSEIK